MSPTPDCPTGAETLSYIDTSNESCGGLETFHRIEKCSETRVHDVVVESVGRVGFADVQLFELHGDHAEGDRVVVGRRRG